MDWNFFQNSRTPPIESLFGAHYEKIAVADRRLFCLLNDPAPVAHAADTCAAQSAEKKLAGAAKSNLEKKCAADAAGDNKPMAKADAKPMAKAGAKK